MKRNFCQPTRAGFLSTHPTKIMKTTASFVAFTVGSLLVSVAFGANTPPAAPAPSPKSSAVASDQPSPATPPEKLSPPLAESKATEKAIQHHIRRADPSVMETPPPAPRAETKPESPSAGLVWVPGHWAAVKGEWQWNAGMWSIPATPSSIWIPAKYDVKTKQWSAGYWQPDRPQPIEPQLPAKDAPTATPAPAPY